MKHTFRINRVTVFLSMFLIFFTSSSNILAFADDKNEKEQNIPLSVSINTPKNQTDKDIGYFKLKVDPGEKQDLSITLHNSSDKEIKAKVAVNTVTTSMTGSLDYSQIYEKDKKDTSLKYPMSEILVPEKEEVTVPAKSKLDVKFKLSVPAEKFEGILLGGIKVDQIDQKEKVKQKSGVVINNKFSYTVGVELSEEVEVEKSDLKLIGIEASQLTGRNTVLAKLQHTTPKIVDEVTYDAKVKKKNGTEFLHENKSSGFRIAPNSTYQYPISWENQRFQAGEYIYSLVVTSEATGEKWEFEEPFTITREEANKLNEKAVDVGPDYTKWIIIGVITLLVVIILILILVNIIQKKKKKNKRAKKSGKSSKHKKSSNKKRK